MSSVFALAGGLFFLAACFAVRFFSAVAFLAVPAAFEALGACGAFGLAGRFGAAEEEPASDSAVSFRFGFGVALAPAGWLRAARPGQGDVRQHSQRELQRREQGVFGDVCLKNHTPCLQLGPLRFPALDLPLAFVELVLQLFSFGLELLLLLGQLAQGCVRLTADDGPDVRSSARLPRRARRPKSGPRRPVSGNAVRNPDRSSPGPGAPGPSNVAGSPEAPLLRPSRHTPCMARVPWGCPSNSRHEALARCRRRLPFTHSLEVSPMLELYFSQSIRLKQMRNGPLATQLDALATRLHAEGYRPSSACTMLRRAGYFNRTLGWQGVGANDITPKLVDEYIARVGTESRCLGLASTLNRLMRELREDWGSAAATPEDEPPKPFGDLLDDYASWMRDVRGLAEPTIDARLRGADRFLVWWRAAHPADELDAMMDGEVLDYIRDGELSRSQISDLRQLYRYLQRTSFA